MTGKEWDGGEDYRWRRVLRYTEERQNAQMQSVVSKERTETWAWWREAESDRLSALNGSLKHGGRRPSAHRKNRKEGGGGGGGGAPNVTWCQRSGECLARHSVVILNSVPGDLPESSLLILITITVIIIIITIITATVNSSHRGPGHRGAGVVLRKVEAR